MTPEIKSLNTSGFLERINTILGPSKSNGFIKFDPQKIVEVVQKLDRQRQLFTLSMDIIKRKSEGLKGSWQGESSAVYFNKMLELDAIGDELAIQLESFSQDLVKVSGVYSSGEAKAKQQSESLPTDGVFRI